MNKFCGYVVVMIAITVFNVEAMKKSATVSSDLRNRGKSDVRTPKDSAAMNVVHVKNDESCPDDLFHKLMTSEIARNQLKRKSFESLEESIKQLDNEMEQIQTSNRLLDTYYGADQNIGLGSWPAYKEITKNYETCVAHAQEMYMSRASQGNAAPPLCGNIVVPVIQEYLEKIRTLRTHHLHASFGLHDKLTRKDVTHITIAALRRYLHVDLTFAALEKHLMSRLLIIDKNSCCTVS